MTSQVATSRCATSCSRSCDTCCRPSAGEQDTWCHFTCHSRSTVCAVRMVEAVELIACRVFNTAEQTRARLTFGDVASHRPAGRHPRDCDCGRCPLGAQGDGAAGLCDRQRLAASGAQDRDQAIAELLSKLAGDG